jgi:hypothetical protein
MSASIKDAMYSPLGEIKSRPGRGGTYDYVSWKNVADRMNEVFGINWTSEVVSEHVSEKEVVVRVRVSVYNKDGAAFSQEGYGGALNDERSEAGNPFKSAYSKAFKDACKKWGVGLYLEEDGVQEEQNPPSAPTSSIPEGYMGKEHGTPPESPLPAQDQYIPRPPEVKVEEEVAVNPPSEGSTPGSMNLPPGVSLAPMDGSTQKEVSASVSLSQEEVTP